MEHARAIATIFVVLFVASCGGRDDGVRILDAACAFGQERALGAPDGPIVHGVALARAPGGAWAVWSERAGAFARELDAAGGPRGETLRLGRACDGGLAAASHRDTLLVACGRRGDEARDDDGGVQLIAVRTAEAGAGGRMETRASVGALGPDGDGVALAVDGAGAATIGWQEARGAITQSWLQQIAEGAAPERLSSPRFRGSRPTLGWQGDRLVVAWAETWQGERGRAEGRIMVRSGTRAARAGAEIAFDAPLPVLRDGVAGDVVLAFRDRRPAGSRPRVQVARVRDDGAALDRVESGSHANAIGESVAIGCGQDVFVVAPRTHSRTERLASVRRYSRELAPQGPEMQIYEHGAAFEHADALCVEGRLLVLFASRPSRLQPRGSVRAVPVVCAREP